MLKQSVLAALALTAATSSYATPFTTTSPTSSGAVPSGVTAVGGIVLDIVGTNGARVVAQLGASSLFQGFAPTSPTVIGTQMGLTAGLLAQLGGGFAELAVRVTLHDGDTAAGNFDQNQNFFLLNGVNVGNWSSVDAQQTDSSGTVAGTMSGGGFRDNTLDTGWFYVDNGALLTSIYNSIVSTGQLEYSMTDNSPNDNFYDFKQGVDGGLINTNVPPVVSGVPDGGATLMLLGSAIGMLGMFKRRKA